MYRKAIKKVCVLLVMIFTVTNSSAIYGSNSAPTADISVLQAQIDDMQIKIAALEESIAALEAKLESVMAAKNVSEVSDAAGETESPEQQPSTKPTIGQANALNSAIQYLDFSAFSHQGLVKQLEYEKYSHDDAVYAADNCGADWNEQAAESAKAYLAISSFSRDGLIKQLVYEGFTNDQAEYGVKKNGY